MNIKQRMTKVFTIIIVTMTGLSACGEEQESATNLSVNVQDLTQMGSQKNSTQPNLKRNNSICG